MLNPNFPIAGAGLSLLQELVQKNSKIPVVFFSEQGTLSDRLVASQLGSPLFLHKPLSPYAILKAITDVLQQNQLQHDNRVLMVDDEAPMIDCLVILLQPLGIEVIGLTNPQQFWSVLPETMPNLLVLDQAMPDFDGVVLCQTVRSAPRWQNLPIVFLSAHTQANDLDRAFRAGADDYLSKSIGATELATRIMHRLQRGGFRSHLH